MIALILTGAFILVMCLLFGLVIYASYMDAKELEACTHQNQKIMVLGAAVNCEETITYCPDCGKVLNHEIDC